MYSEKQIKTWFETVKNNSYTDLSIKVVIKDLKFKMTGYSSPFNGNVYIGLSLINKQNLSKESIIGILAHELSHQVSYKKRSFFPNIFFLWNYWFSVNKRREVEREADEITVQRGYGKELLAERESEDKYYCNDKKTLELLKKVYLGPNAIRKLIKKYSKK